MRITSVVALCCISFALASCADKQASTCVGTSAPAMSLESMSAVDKYFMTTDFNQYLGSNLGRLERDFPIKYTERTAGTNPPTRLVGVTYTFPNNYSIKVYFSEVKHTTYNSSTHKWDFRKLNKEVVTGINVKHYGTGDEYYCSDFGEVSL